jgi:hypothetical protein
MCYTSILVHVDAEGPLEGRSKIAAELADRFNALLIGLSGWALTSGLIYEQAFDRLGSLPAYHLRFRHVPNNRSCLQYSCLHHPVRLKRLAQLPLVLY